jgi:membrane-associated protein
MFGIDVNSLIQSGGLLLVAAIVFAESGLLIGFFLPGDTLLLAAGILAAQGKLPLPLTILVIIIAALVGDNTGYMIGKKTGHRIFHKEESALFHPSHIKRAEAFYQKHGGKTILFARFLPILRTFAPLVAGMGHMPRRRFLPFDAVGCVVWGAGVTLIGYWFGSKIPNIDHYILPTILAVSVLTFSPAVYHLVKEPSNRARIKKIFRFNRGH